MRAGREIGRLKAHLLEVEEQHTQDAVAYHNAEASLKQANAQLQEKIQAHSLLFSATR